MVGARSDFANERAEAGYIVAVIHMRLFFSSTDPAALGLVLPLYIYPKYIRVCHDFGNNM